MTAEKEGGRIRRMGNAGQGDSGHMAGQTHELPTGERRPAGNETGPVFFLDQRDQHTGRRERYGGSRAASSYASEVGKLARLSPITAGILPSLERRLEWLISCVGPGAHGRKGGLAG
jgi:hypothetical protein